MKYFYPWNISCWMLTYFIKIFYDYCCSLIRLEHVYYILWYQIISYFYLLVYIFSCFIYYFMEQRLYMSIRIWVFYHVCFILQNTMQPFCISSLCSVQFIGWIRSTRILSVACTIHLFGPVSFCFIDFLCIDCQTVT